jgi:hypothetical protein
LASPAWSAVLSIATPTLSNYNPSPGSQIWITWSFTQPVPGAAVFSTVALSSQCAPQPGNTAGQTFLVGDQCSGPESSVSQNGCWGGVNNVPQLLTLPNTLVPGNTYYLTVMMASYGVSANPGPVYDATNCVSFTAGPISTPTPIPQNCGIAVDNVPVSATNAGSTLV